MKFEWDKGNREKCQKHGLLVEEIETILKGEPAIFMDPFPKEPRFRAIGMSPTGRMTYIVFTIREQNGEQLIRPVSARYMHEREIKRYE